MNRKERRAYKREQYTFVSALPDELTLVPPNEYPKLHGIVKVWRSRKYLAQLYEESRLNYPGLLRLSVCRSTQDVRGGWLVLHMNHKISTTWVCPNGHTDVEITGSARMSVGHFTVTVNGVSLEMPGNTTDNIFCRCKLCHEIFTVVVDVPKQDEVKR